MSMTLSWKNLAKKLGVKRQGRRWTISLPSKRARRRQNLRQSCDCGEDAVSNVHSSKVIPHSYMREANPLCAVEVLFYETISATLTFSSILERTTLSRDSPGLPGGTGLYYAKNTLQCVEVMFTLVQWFQGWFSNSLLGYLSSSHRPSHINLFPLNLVKSQNHFENERKDRTRTYQWRHKNDPDE